jgi:hypothetical protein
MINAHFLNGMWAGQSKEFPEAYKTIKATEDPEYYYYALWTSNPRSINVFYSTAQSEFERNEVIGGILFGHLFKVKKESVSQQTTKSGD